MFHNTGDPAAVSRLFNLPQFHVWDVVADEEGGRTVTIDTGVTEAGCLALSPVGGLNRHHLTNIGDSTDASNTSAAPHSASSATSPTTSPDPSSKPEASDPNYTLDCDEPLSRPFKSAARGQIAISQPEI